MATIFERKLKNGIVKRWITSGNFKGGKIERSCLMCGKLFYVFPCVIKVGKGNYCSQKCVRKAIPNAKGKHWKMPEGFGERVKVRMSGEKNPNYKHGLSRIISKRYWDAQFKNWRKRVFERDNYTCQICKKKGCYITAHHIKSWLKFPELRFDVNNGKTLCEVCHSLTDNYKGRARVNCN